MAKEKTTLQEEVITTATPIIDEPSRLSIQDRLSVLWEKNSKVIGIALGAAAVIVLGVVGYKMYQSSQNETAASKMFVAEQYFEKDSLDLALLY